MNANEAIQTLCRFDGGESMPHSDFSEALDVLAHELERLREDRDARMASQFRLQDERDLATQARDAAVAECERLQEERDAADSQVIHWKRLHGGVEDERDRLREALEQISGYVRAHLAGNDADPELKWALELADSALSGDTHEDEVATVARAALDHG